MTRTFLELDERITLTAGQSLVDTDVFVPATFGFDTALCAIYVAGSGVTIRNVRLYTYVDEFLESWSNEDAHGSTGTGIPFDMVGIRCAGDIKGLHLESVHIEGFPLSGFTGSRMEDCTFERVSVTRCSDGLYFGYDAGLAKRIRMDGISVWDTWSGLVSIETGTDEDHYSVSRPGYAIGGDGLAGYWDDFSFARLHFSGEMFTAFKAVRSKRGEIRKCHGNQMFLQGTQGRNENIDLTTDGTTGVVLRDCDIRKEYGVGMVSSPGGAASGIQITWNVTDCQIVDTYIDGTGGDGHGIQESGDCEMDIRGCTITGFNQTAGVAPAYALNLNDGSTANADFLTVNDLTGQDLLVSVSG